MYLSAHMEVMGQSTEVSSLLLRGCGDQPQAVRCGAIVQLLIFAF